MNAQSSRREFFVALLIAVCAHVGLFFVFVLLMVFDLLSARLIERDEGLTKKDPLLKMQMFYEEEIAIEETSISERRLESADEVEQDLEGLEEAEGEESVSRLVPPDGPAFVQTEEEQESEVAPANARLIGERNTIAASDEGAEEGGEKMATLSGAEDVTSDPKTFDSDFSAGESSKGRGESERESEGLSGRASVLSEQKAEESERGKEDQLGAEINELASLEETLAVLDEAISEENEISEETSEEKGGEHEFASEAIKTRVAGVFHAKGKGALNVANTPLGQYEAALLSKLETAWQIDNKSHRLLNAPGKIVFSFAVNQDGRISRMKHVLRVGTSDNQWGRVIGLVDLLACPKMPKEVIRELKGEVLELTVTLNY